MGMQEVAIKMNLDAQSVVSSAQNISDAFARITGKMKEAQEAGNIDLVGKYSQQAQGLQRLYNGMATGSGQAGGTEGVKGAVSTANQAGNTANTVIQQLGSKGDVTGAALSGAKSGLDVLGNMGGSIASVAGIFSIGLLPLMLSHTLTGFYQQQMKPAMDINARLNNTERALLKEEDYDKLSTEEKLNYIPDGKGGYLETAEHRTAVNTENINTAFKKASEAAINLGYSMEEGMEVVRNATQHGYTSNDIYEAEKHILSWNSATGVDTGLLSDYLGRQHRFTGSDGNSLAQAFAVNNKTGMIRGQFSETLEALKSIFEDGISKGFSKSTASIGSTLVMLYQSAKTAGGGQEKFWQGEQGARRYMQMSDAIAGATALDTVENILTYRAVATMEGNTKKKLLAEVRKNAGIKGSYGYIDNNLILEQGVTPELLVAQRDMVEQTAGKNNEKEQIEMYRKMYGLNYTGATQVYEMMKQLKNGKDTVAKRERIAEGIKKIQSDPQYLSEQKAMVVTSESIREKVTQIGAFTAKMENKLGSIVNLLGEYFKSDSKMTGFDFFKAIIFGVEEENLCKNVSEEELKNKKLELENALDEAVGDARKASNAVTYSTASDYSSVSSEEWEADKKATEKVNKLRKAIQQVEEALAEKQNTNAKNNTSNQQQESTGKPWLFSCIVNAIIEGLHKSDIHVFPQNSGI